MTRPVIGITCDYDWKNERNILNSGYVEGVYKAGGLPMLIPFVNPTTTIAKDIISNIDALLLTGGQDLDSYYFGEAPHPKIGNINPYRDELEFALVKEAVYKDIPILGICRGCQLMNVFMGGDLYQDITSQVSNRSLICHDQNAPRWFAIHEVFIKEDTMLKSILVSDSIRTNSFHHQAVRQLGSGLVVNSFTDDGVIEGFESTNLKFFMGIQWHPECMLNEYPITLELFEGFVNAARR